MVRAPCADEHRAWRPPRESRSLQSAEATASRLDPRRRLDLVQGGRVSRPIATPPIRANRQWSVTVMAARHRCTAAGGHVARSGV